MTTSRLSSSVSAPDTRHGMVLYMENVSVSFDGFKALNDLNLYIKKGELRCLIGANGAGKTTLMDVITGKTRPDTGTISYGQQINLLQHNEEKIARMGIGRKFQKPTVFEALSVRDNLYLSLKMDRGIWTSLWHQLSGEERDDIYSILETIGLHTQQHRLAGELSHGQKQWLEIGMLLAAEPQLLLVDEPVAGMTVAEAERTAQLLTSLAGAHSVVVVEHDMGFVRAIARTVTVLHQGSVLAEGSMDAISQNEDVKRVYLGEESDD
jgi:urea transport system ATP-binding protein